MANPKDKYKDNDMTSVEFNGKKLSFYVDIECILCSACTDEAPDNFRISDHNTHDICFKQPQTDEELEQCYNALSACPVEAIGDNGAEQE